MHYVASERVENIKSKEELPEGSGGAIYVWVALRPKGDTERYTNYVGQTSNSKMRLSSTDHKGKINGDMDVFVFHLAHSTVNHRNILERLVHDYMQWAGGFDYQMNSINEQKPYLPKIVPKEMFDESYEEFHKIADELQVYLGFKQGSRSHPYFNSKNYLAHCKKKGKMGILTPTIKTKEIAIYNPFIQEDYYKPNRLVEGSIIVLGGRYYTFSNKMGRDYYKEEEAIKYLLSPYNQEWLEPLEWVEDTPKGEYPYQGRAYVKKG